MFYKGTYYNYRWVYDLINKFISLKNEHNAFVNKHIFSTNKNETLKKELKDEKYMYIELESAYTILEEEVKNLWGSEHVAYVMLGIMSIENEYLRKEVI